MSHKIPGFSFWALLTAAIIFVALKALGAPTVLTVSIPVIWYLLGYGVAYGTRKFHFPEYEQHLPAGADQIALQAPPGMLSVTFTNQQKTIFVNPGDNLRKAAKKQGVQVYYDVTKLFNCQGFGFCGTCRFAPDAKNPAAFSDPSWQEKFTLGDSVGKLRLSCQTNVNGNCVIDNTAAKDIGYVHHYAVLNGALLGLFSLLIFGVVIWIGGDMIGLF